MDRMRKTGQVKACHSLEVNQSRIGLGFEKLDRDVFDPEKAYDRVAESGVKWIRIQSGWARTEREPGVYDFAWLDAIIDNLRIRGLKPWICLCYGNGLYDEAAAKVFGSVGCPPINNAAQKQAWHDYVSRLTARYRGKITHYEVWNEPDGAWCWKQGPNGAEYGEFVIATAAAVREGDPAAKVIAGSVCLKDMAWLCAVAATGALTHADALTYHEYSEDETGNIERVRVLRSFCTRFNPDIKIIQGESGSQSRSDGAGALAGMAWTPLRQAKQLLRHTLSDLLCEVEFLSYFSCMDMIEALNGTVGDKASYLDYGYFGVLGADFDEDGRSTGDYTPKPSYYALQNIASLFREDFNVVDLPVIGQPTLSRRVHRDDRTADLTTGAFSKPNGSSAFVYWKPTPLLTTTYEGTVTWQVAGVKGQPRLVDLLDGAIYEIPDAMVQDEGNGCYRLLHLPVMDYPLLLTFGDFF